MQHPVTSSIVDLPDEVLSAVVTSLTSYAHGNPGDVCRLMLVCMHNNAFLLHAFGEIAFSNTELQKVKGINAHDGALLAEAVPEAGLGVCDSYKSCFMHVW